MKNLLVLCAVAVVVAGVGSGRASAAPVRSTLSGAITEGGGWCCGSYGTVEGTATVSGVGRVSFDAYRETGHDPYQVPMTAFTTEQVVLTAMNGDTLTLAGGSDTQDSGGLVVPWSMSAARAVSAQRPAVARSASTSTGEPRPARLS